MRLRKDISLLSAKVKSGQREGLRQMTVVRGLARNLIEVQGISLDTADLRSPSKLKRARVFEVDFGSNGLEIYKVEI